MAPVREISSLTGSAVLRMAAVVCVIAAGVAIPGTAHADEIRDKQWHLRYLDIGKAHEITRGEGVTVAVLDTGVDYRHPNLKGALLEGRTYAGGRSDGWEDPDGHGTAMACLVAGRGHGPGQSDGVLGIAPAAKVLPVRTKHGELGEFRAIVQGIEWAVDHDADILSISQAWTDVPDVQEAVNYALKKGAVVVASVGNITQMDDDVVAPALYPGVVAVSGTDQDGTFADESVSGPEVGLSAPATEIMSGGAGKRGRYATATGTSNSTAIVAGVAALVMSKYPELDAANVINRLIATADDRGPEGRDPQYGFGIVDPVAALTKDVPKVDANPLLTPSKPPTTASRSAGASGPGVGSYGLLALGVLLVVVTLGAGVLVVAGTRRRRTPAVPSYPVAPPPGAPHPSAPPPGVLGPPGPPPEGRHRG